MLLYGKFDIITLRRKNPAIKMGIRISKQMYENEADRQRKNLGNIVTQR